jgi:hypothetical protein
MQLRNIHLDCHQRRVCGLRLLAVCTAGEEGSDGILDRCEFVLGALLQRVQCVLQLLIPLHPTQLAPTRVCTHTRRRIRANIAGSKASWDRSGESVEHGHCKAPLPMPFSCALRSALQLADRAALVQLAVAYQPRRHASAQNLRIDYFACISPSVGHRVQAVPLDDWVRIYWGEG